MKKIYFLFAILFATTFNAQEVLNDHWQNIVGLNFTPTTINYKASTVVNNKVIMIVDTLPIGLTDLSGLYTYDINTRNLGNISFTLDPGDRGIRCATSYKTSTPGLEYGIFGCYASSDVGVSYPVVYTYNGQTNTIIADSLNYGSNYDHDGGVQNIVMFSPSTNNDSMRVFSVYNLGINVFTKHINQTSFTASYLPVNIDYINASCVHNNKLYIAGMYLNQPCLLESTDGRTFTNVAGFIPPNFPQYSCVNNLASFNNQLYYSISLSPSDYHIFRFDNVNNHFLVQSSASSQRIKTFAVYKNRLWYSTAKNEPSSITSHISSIDAADNIYSSAFEFGYQDINGDQVELVSNNDSLCFVGIKGTFQALKAPIVGITTPMTLINKYINIAKLNPPTASFNYNNNQICLNANETFTSTSQNTDSLHWLIDNIYYASSPGATAWMNINFPSTGNHSVGLVAFGGTLSDTAFLSVNVYSVSASIAATRTLVCYNSSVSGSSEFSQTTSGTMGTISYQWQRDFPVTTVGTGNTYTYTPSSFGTTYSFWLIATDVHGCSAYSNTITVNTNPLYDIDGTLYSGSSPTITSVQGNVVLYKYQPTLGMFDSLTYLTTTSWGYFDFSGIDDGDYILKAIPSASSLQISYYGNNAVMWKDAVPFSHTCASPNTNTINVIPLSNIGVGPGELSGQILQSLGFGSRMANEGAKPLIPGTPIGGIIVKGGKNPGGQMFVQTTTATDGTYTLTGLPISTDDYFVMVDIPGLDTNGTYHRYITASTSTITGLDFTVDSIYVNPIGAGMITAVSSENSVFENKIQLFPNPAKEFAYIEYELTESANVQIELYDLIGQKIKTIQADSKKDKNKHKHTIDLGDFSSGIYFVKVKINNSENVIKLIITN